MDLTWLSKKWAQLDSTWHGPDLIWYDVGPNWLNSMCAQLDSTRDVPYLTWLVACHSGLNLAVILLDSPNLIDLTRPKILIFGIIVKGFNR